MSTPNAPRSNPSKQRKHHRQSAKQREQQRAHDANIFREGYDMGYSDGLAEGLRRVTKGGEK